MTSAEQTESADLSASGTTNSKKSASASLSDGTVESNMGDTNSKSLTTEDLVVETKEDKVDVLKVERSGVLTPKAPTGQTQQDERPAPAVVAAVPAVAQPESKAATVRSDAGNKVASKPLDSIESAIAAAERAIETDMAKEPSAPRRWHSKTGRAMFVELSLDDVVFLREMNGNVKVLERVTFEDAFLQVGAKQRVVGPTGVAEIFSTAKGIVVLDGEKTIFFDNKDAAVKAGYQVP